MPTSFELNPEEQYDAVMKVKIVGAKYDYKAKCEQQRDWIVGLKKSLTHFHDENVTTQELLKQRDQTIELINKEKEGLTMDVADLRVQLEAVPKLQKETEELKSQLDEIEKQKAAVETERMEESKAKFEFEFKLKKEKSQVKKTVRTYILQQYTPRHHTRTHLTDVSLRLETLAYNLQRLSQLIFRNGRWRMLRRN